MKREITAGDFQLNCLELLDEVQQSRTELVITKSGKPVARLLPAEIPEIFGRMRGTARILGDIVGPTGEKWEADE